MLAGHGISQTSVCRAAPRSAIVFYRSRVRAGSEALATGRMSVESEISEAMLDGTPQATEVPEATGRVVRSGVRCRQILDESAHARRCQCQESADVALSIYYLLEFPRKLC